MSRGLSRWQDYFSVGNNIGQLNYKQQVLHQRYLTTKFYQQFLTDILQN
jgi:hypothetical protein